MKESQKHGLLKRRIMTGLVILAFIALTAGGVLAWFANQYRLSSVAKIHPLTYISILAPGDSVLQQIDLSYDKSEVKNGRVELKRPFVIRSETENYDLCIAHTTNISGLSINLYQAETNGSEGNAYLSGITEWGTSYYWNKSGSNLFTKDKYVNNGMEENNRILADKNHKAHEETFRLSESESYSNVQKYVEPLYWVSSGTGHKRDSDDGYYYTNYILEISWDETDKETDILYVIAQTGEQENGNN